MTAMANVRWIPVLLAAGLLGLSVRPAPAQPVPSALEEREKVALRLIDVTVLQRDGSPFLGLGPDDFTVQMAGSEREILSFDAARGTSFVRAERQREDAPAPLEAEIAEEPAADPARWVVICLDADRIPHNYRKLVLETTRALIADGTRPGDQVAVALLLNGEMRFLQPFAPPEEIELGLFENPGMLLSTGNDLRFRVDEMVELVQSCPDTLQQSACVLTRTEEFLHTIRRENDSGLRALRGLVGAMAPLPGRKAFVWMSNGFVLEPGVVVMEAMSRYLGTDADPIYSRLKDIGSADYESLLWEATRARVSFYSLRAGHDISQAMRGAAEASTPHRIAGVAGDPYKMTAKLGEEALRDVAEATGGRAIFTPLGPKVASGLLQNLDAIYTLGVAVRPEDPIRPRIKVRLSKKHKGKVRVSKPLPWRAQPPDRLTAWMAIPPGSPPGTGGITTLVLHLSMDGLAIEKDRESGSETSRVALYAQVRSSDGPALEHTYTVLEFPRGVPGVGDFTYDLGFRLDPGEYLAEASVSDLVGGGKVSVAKELTVPPPATGRAAAGRP